MMAIHVIQITPLSPSRVAAESSDPLCAQGVVVLASLWSHAHQMKGQDV